MSDAEGSCIKIIVFGMWSVFLFVISVRFFARRLRPFSGWADENFEKVFDFEDDWKMMAGGVRADAFSPAALA